MTYPEFQSWALAQGQVGRYDNGQFIGECVSLINQYCYRVLNVPAGSWGDAWQWGQASNANVQKYFEFVPDAGKQAGDIIIYPKGWAGSAPGHIGLYAGQILEQNGHVSRKVSLSKLEPGYYAILRLRGAIVPGGDSMTRPQMAQVKFLALRHTGDITDAEYEKYKDSVDNWMQYLQALQVEGNYPDFNPSTGGVKPYDGPALFVKD